MKSWIAVFDHPFFAVTDKHGNYSIENVPKRRIYCFGISGEV